MTSCAKRLRILVLLETFLAPHLLWCVDKSSYERQGEHVYFTDDPRRISTLLSPRLVEV
jgi:hypothetical protein